VKLPPRCGLGLLDKLFGRRGATDVPEAAVACPHVALTARWDAPEEMGNLERASSFHCEACGADFSGEEGRRLLR
jgi:hypothetical protein